MRLWVALAVGIAALCLYGPAEAGQPTSIAVDISKAKSVQNVATTLKAYVSANMFAVEAAGYAAGLDTVSIGTNFACAVTATHTVRCWGANSVLQSTPPPGLAGIVSVSAGDQHACALASDGTVTCWGNTAGGVTAVPAGLSGVVQVDAGKAATCAVTDLQALVCWGQASIAYVPSALVTEAVRFVSLGTTHACATTATDQVICWGSDTYGESSPPSWLPPVRRTYASAGFSCALLQQATVVCWGTNDLGQAAPPAGLEDVGQLSLGSSHACALRSGGETSCWGSGKDGATRVESFRLTDPAASLAAGSIHSCLLTTSGGLFCAGSYYNDDQGINPPRPGSGTVTLNVDGNFKSSVLLQAAFPKFSVPTSNYGSLTIEVIFSGNEDYDASQSGSITHLVTAPPSLKPASWEYGILPGEKFSIDLNPSDADEDIANLQYSVGIMSGYGTASVNIENAKLIIETNQNAFYSGIIYVKDKDENYMSYIFDFHTGVIVQGSDIGERTNMNIANSIYYGNGGDDIVDGRANNLRLYGGAGNDLYNIIEYYVSDGHDVEILESKNAGYDTIVTSLSISIPDNVEELIQAGNNRQVIGNEEPNKIQCYFNCRVSSGSGDDSIYLRVRGSGSLNRSYIDGGAGIDAIFLPEKGNGIKIIDLSDKIKVINGKKWISSDWDYIAVDAKSGLSTVENIVGTSHQDYITGDAGPNFLSSGENEDILAGMGGADVLAGGPQSDVFRYFAVSDSRASRPDRIVDFADGDLIDISKMDIRPRTKGRQGFRYWRGTRRFTGRWGELRFNKRLNAYEGDANGDRKADFRILIGNPSKKSSRPEEQQVRADRQEPASFFAAEAYVGKGLPPVFLVESRSRAASR